MNSQCPKKDVCGSCGWSHIPYEKQLAQKLSDINGSFKIKKVDLHVDEIIASPKTDHYRNRMDFVIDFQGQVGLREKGKWWRVIDNHSCFIADEKIDTLFLQVRDWVKTSGLSFFDRKAHTGLLRYAVIRSSSIGQTMINIVTSAPESEFRLQSKNGLESNFVEEALKQLAEQTDCTTLIWSINHTITDVSFGDELKTIAGPGYIEETTDGHQFRISPNAFFQTNSFTSPLLLKTVEKFAGDLTGKTLLDLYCGTGFFAVAMAGRAKKTIGVELVPEAIADARVNATLNQVEVDFHDAKTESFDWMSLGADVVILDPPRSGMHDQALADIIKTKPPTIVYVSCNYKNFAREMVQLGQHYDVTKMRAIDMFPQTPHVELVSLLTLRPKSNA